MAEILRGPAAPTDPEKARPYFYIIRDKQIYGSKQEDGTGVQFLYQSDGRLESGAKVVGGLEDEELLKLLGTVEGFNKLVHSIGVSIEMDDPSTEAEFVFQMYGKVDLYGGGTNLISKQKADGSEKKIYLDDIKWTEDDNIPGQIRIHMPEPDKTGNLSVRLFLRDGFEAPEQIDDKAVDLESKDYKALIKKSLISTGKNPRLKEKLAALDRGEDVTIAFIGGSITQGAGATPINTECYAYKTYCKLKSFEKRENSLHFIKAGVGGTPSELGMVRFNRDVLRDGSENPDIVIVEFAVNDEGDETKGNCYESLVRKILKLKNNPAVVLLYSVFADDYNLEDRLIPVGERYGLPMVSVKRALVDQFYDRDSRVISKNQYFYDIFHPTNLGHTVMADSLVNLFEEVRAGAFEEDYDFKFNEEAAIGKGFDEVYLMDKKDTCQRVEINPGDFLATDSVLQSVEMDEDLELTPEFPYNWMYEGGSTMETYRPFTMKLNCRRLVLIFKDSGEVDAAKANVYVDGEFVRVADPYINRWLHCNPIIIIDNEESAEHTVEIKVCEDELDKKFTILGFGIVD